jgi:hypothetical protein
MQTFEEFLKEAIAKNGEVRLVPRQYTSDSPVIFYAHVNGKDSNTVDFAVVGNALTPVVDERGGVITNVMPPAADA